MLSRRFEGLKCLRSCQLPTPDWVIVANEPQIHGCRLADTEFGWTVRTCRTDGQRETGGYFRNNLSPKAVEDELIQRTGRFAKGEFYLIYPSWEFFLSFNVVKTEDSYLFEGKYGSQKGISMGADIPDFCAEFPLGIRGLQRQHIAPPDDEAGKYVGPILRYCNRLPWAKFYLEVAVTTRKQIVFYELFINK